MAAHVPRAAHARGVAVALALCCAFVSSSLLFVVTSVSPAQATSIPAGAPSPITPTNRPSALSGQINGEVDPTQLVTVVNGCRLARAAATSLELMLAAAHGDGVGLGTEDCYRPFSDQVTVRAQSCAAGNCACAAAVPTTPGVQGGTSMHGWGKAVDFLDAGHSITSTSMVGYRWLKANAARYGWNHPGWAEPGGSSCPEAWHWEWVGDGGDQHLGAIVTEQTAAVATPSGHGLLVVSGLGQPTARGDAVAHGGIATGASQAVTIAAAGTPTGNGYWITDVSGAITPFGDAGTFGDTHSIALAQPIVGMAPTASGKGYRLVAGDGGVFCFGDAPFYGSMGGVHLFRPMVGMATTPTGEGYWLVASDGGMFTFGDARFYGSTGGRILNRPVVGVAPTPSGHGYWLVADDGGVFTFGDAAFYGSLGGTPGVSPVVAIAATPTGHGYWLIGANGSITPYGDALALS